MARWLLTDAEVLLLFDVTRGVDAATKHDIYELVADLAAPRQGDPVLLQRDRGDRQPVPPGPRAARGPGRGRARRSGRRRGAHRRRVAEGGARCVRRSCARAPAARGTGRARLRRARRRPPSPTSSSTPPTWATCPPRSTTCPSSTPRCRWCSSPIGQSLVVLTGGIDLSVGGIVSLLRGGHGDQGGRTGAAPFGWLLARAARSARPAARSTASIVAKGRIAPILTTLATLSIFSGLALWVLPVPGGSISPGGAAGADQPQRAHRADLARAGGRWAGSCCAGPGSACGCTRSAATRPARAPSACRRPG